MAGDLKANYALVDSSIFVTIASLPSPPCLEERDKFAQLTTSVSLEHLDFAPDPSGKWLGGLSSGGKESSQAVEVVQRTIVPPKPTVVRRRV